MAIRQFGLISGWCTYEYNVSAVNVRTLHSIYAQVSMRCTGHMSMVVGSQPHFVLCKFGVVAHADDTPTSPPIRTHTRTYVCP